MVRISYRHWLFRFPLVRRYQGMVLGRRILFKGSKQEVSPELLRHELVHQAQMDRHSIPGFYLIYLKDYLRNLVVYRNHDKAYWNIPFESEARAKPPQGKRLKLI